MSPEKWENEASQESALPYHEYCGGLPPTNQNQEFTKSMVKHVIDAEKHLPLLGRTQFAWGLWPEIWVSLVYREIASAVSAHCRWRSFMYQCKHPLKPLLPLGRYEDKPILHTSTSLTHWHWGFVQYSGLALLQNGRDRCPYKVQLRTNQNTPLWVKVGHMKRDALSWEKAEHVIWTKIDGDNKKDASWNNHHYMPSCLPNCGWKDVICIACHAYML